MIEHLWTILCELSITDADTSALTLVNVQEGFEVPAVEVSDDSYELTEVGKLQLVSSWFRLPMDESVSGLGRYVLVTPTGEFDAGIEFPIDLTKRNATRIIGNMSGLPVSRPGIYEFQTQIRQDGQDGQVEWRQVAKTPVVVTFRAASTQEGERPRPV